METLVPRTTTVLRPWVRITILTLIFLIFMSGVGIILKGFELKKQESNVNSIYDYSINQNLDYKVFLNKNSFIESEYLGKNETYISDLIKNIQFTFMYNFSGTKSIPLHYTYGITATIKGEYSIATGEDKSKVWTKKYNILDTKDVDVVQSQFTIKEDIELDFNRFNEEVIQFRKQLNLPISAILLIEMEININGELENKLEDKKVITVQFPLNTQAFNITTNYESSYNGQVLEKAEYKCEMQNRNLIIGITLIILSLFILVMLFKKIFNLQKKSNYNLKLNKILKSYGDVIIELATPISTEGYSVVDVKNFNEMIDLEEELRKPINFYETIDNYEGEFYIINDNIIYRYLLTNEED